MRCHPLHDADNPTNPVYHFALTESQYRGVVGKLALWWGFVEWVDGGLALGEGFDMVVAPSVARALAMPRPVH